MSGRDRWAHHVGPRSKLHRSIWLAGYYRWCVLRGHPAPGRHPLTGAEVAAWRIEDQALSRAVHIAQTRFYLGKARSLRAGARVLP